MSRYLSLCDYSSLKFGDEPDSWFTLYSVLYAAGCVIPLAMGTQTSVSATVAVLAAAAAARYLALETCHEQLPALLSKNKVGLKRGGQIVRSAQFASLSLPFLIASALYEPEHHEATEPVADELPALHFEFPQ